MSKVDDLIKQYCPHGVKYKELGDVCLIEKGQQLNKNSLKNGGEFPVMNGGIYPSGYWNEYNTDSNTIIISQGGASAGYTQFMTVKFWAGAHCYTVKPKEIFNKYLYYFIKNNQNTLMSNQYGAGIPALNKRTLETLRIPVPPLPVQEEIVRVLDTFTALEARKRQYEYYRNKLLTFDENTTGGGRIKFMQLGEVAKISNGKDHKHLDDGEYPVYGSGGIMRYANNFLYNKESVLIPRKGSIGNIFYTNQPFWTVDTIFYTKINFDIMLPKFFYHFLKTQHLEELNFAGGVPSLTKTMLDKIHVPVPPMEEQERIVAILDKFDSLVNDISEGLPAELTARRQQYEYYRNKLLTFDEAA